MTRISPTRPAAIITTFTILTILARPTQASAQLLDKRQDSVSSTRTIESSDARLRINSISDSNEGSITAGLELSPLLDENRPGSFSLSIDRGSSPLPTNINVDVDINQAQTGQETTQTRGSEEDLNTSTKETSSQTSGLNLNLGPRDLQPDQINIETNIEPINAQTSPTFSLRVFPPRPMPPISQDQSDSSTENLQSATSTPTPLSMLTPNGLFSILRNLTGLFF